MRVGLLRHVSLLLVAVASTGGLAACSRCAAVSDELQGVLRAEAARVGAGELPDASGVPHVIYRFGPDLLDALAAAIDPDRVVLGGIYRRVVNQPEPDGLLVDGAAVVLSLQLALDSVAFVPDASTPSVRIRLVDRASRVALNTGSRTQEWTATAASIDVVAPIVFEAADDDAVIVADISSATYAAAGFETDLPVEVAAVVGRLVNDAIAESRSSSEATVELIRLPPLVVATDKLPQRIAKMEVNDGGLELTAVTALRPVGDIDLRMPRGSGAVAHPDLARAAVEYALAVQTGLRRVESRQRPATLTVDALVPVVGGIEGRATLWCVDASPCEATAVDVACTADLDAGDARVACGAHTADSDAQLTSRVPSVFESVTEGVIESLRAQIGGAEAVLPVALGIDSTGLRVGWIANAPP